MFEIIAGLIAAAIFLSCGYRWLFRDETPVLHSTLATVAIFTMMFVAEDGLFEMLRLAVFLIVVGVAGLVLTAALNRGVE